MAKKVKDPHKLDVEFRIEPEVLMEAVSDPDRIPELMRKYNLSKEELGREVERLAKLIAIRADDMIMV